MDNAKQHWKILQKLGNDLANSVREFLVIGKEGKGVIVVTEDGLGYWLGEMKLGTSESKTATKPTLLNVPGPVVQMAQNRELILLLNKRGKIYTMGENIWRQRSFRRSADLEARFTPQLIPIRDKVTSVRCGQEHCLALTENGKVWAWGSNFSGQVGLSTSTRFSPFPNQIRQLDPHRIVAVECGGAHSLALTDLGVVYGWGMNRFGQLGDNVRHSLAYTPTQIPTPSPVKSMAANLLHTFLLTQTGEVYACGRNGHSQLDLRQPILILRLSKVSGLPSISQIASHPFIDMSIAMSSDGQRCFVWGRLHDETIHTTPSELPPLYSMEYCSVESPLSFYSSHRNTPYSIQISETPPSPLSVRMSRMFDNPETSDVQFVVEQRTIHAHQIILRNSSDYFARIFSERWMAQVDPKNPIVKVTISDHSYLVFYAFLRFLYTDYFKLHSDLLPELFVLTSQYNETELKQLCLSRMRITLNPTTCCLYYQLTYQHWLPELAVFHSELVQFISTNFHEVIATDAYQSMDAELCKKLTLSLATQLGMRCYISVVLQLQYNL